LLSDTRIKSPFLMGYNESLRSLKINFTISRMTGRMMISTNKCNFDEILPRGNGDSIKWNQYPADVLPLWVADMDFRAPEAVISALQERVAQGIFGYPSESEELRSAVVDWLAERFEWKVSPEAVILLPGVVNGFNLACQAATQPGDGVLIQTPVYPPFLRVAGYAGAQQQKVELMPNATGRYGIDFDRFEASFTNRTRAFLLCSPHNPVGRVWRRDELERMAKVCVDRDVVICSDEIHADLVFSESRHIPIASLSPEVSERTITLIAPSKTFNIPGLCCSLAIIENETLRRQFMHARRGLVGEVNLLGQTAALAAYRHGADWLEAVLQYLQANRDFLVKTIQDELPQLHIASPEGTYLAWIDCRDAGLAVNPHVHFLDKAKVAMNDGAWFDKNGEGFVRLNFACPRSILEEALSRMIKSFH
jgi:cystathionine beta-lyase